MTGPDVPDQNMPSPADSNRPGGLAIQEACLAALLVGARMPADPPPQLLPLAQALAELAGQPASSELDGEAETLAAFRNQFSVPDAAPRPWAWKPAARLRPRPVHAAAAAVTILSLAGIATAAYAGALPAGLQRLAHDTIAAPAPGSRHTSKPSRTVPAATGHRAGGLCASWAQSKADGTREQQAAAFARLAAAAHGPGNVTAYCATAAHPQTSPSPRPHPAPTPHSAGKPASLPTPHSSGKPTVLPTPHSSGKPTALPTPHSAGKSASLPTPHGSGGPAAHPTGKPPKSS